MKVVFILMILSSICYCGPRYEFKLMNNDEIIRETKRCEDAGLKAVRMVDANRMGNAIYIECRPIDK